jgi:hypothetical protein
LPNLPKCPDRQKQGLNRLADICQRPFLRKM